MRHFLNTITNICKYTAFFADSKTICRHSGGVSRYNTKKILQLGLQDFFVGVTGFEPATTWSQTRCATGLRYAPPFWCICGAKIMLFFILCKSDCCAGRYFLSVACFSAGVRSEEYSAGLPKSCAARATAGSKRMP